MRYEKKLLVGNILISILTAWTIIIVFLCYYSKGLYRQFGEYNTIENYFRKFIRISILYATFSFIISLIREVVKDMEDMEGDAKYGCKTMPIVWGVPATKVFTGVWIVVAATLLFIVQLYAWQSGKWIAAIYFNGFIILPLFYLLYKFRYANVAADYAKLSTIIKLIILAGILSMMLLLIVK